MLWCELVQCFDKKSVMYIRPHKPNGTAAWKTLVGQFKSTERPRVQTTMTKQTSLKMVGGEKITDYLMRAEDLQVNLHDV